MNDDLAARAARELQRRREPDQIQIRRPIVDTPNREFQYPHYNGRTLITTGVLGGEMTTVESFDESIVGKPIYDDEGSPEQQHDDRDGLED